METVNALDLFCHWAPPDYGAAARKAAGRPLRMMERALAMPVMAELDRPILLHPTLALDAPDYAGEAYSKYELWWALGWPYETSKAMYRLVFAGVFDRWPNLKIITHHGGGLIPMVEGRLGAGLQSYGTRTPSELREKENTPLRGEPLAAFKRFYTDTATFGSAAAVECAVKFFGPERMLFATDMPFGLDQGAAHIQSALAVVKELPVTAANRNAILHATSETLIGPQHKISKEKMTHDCVTP